MELIESESAQKEWNIMDLEVEENVHSCHDREELELMNNSKHYTC